MSNVKPSLQIVRARNIRARPRRHASRHWKTQARTQSQPSMRAMAHTGARQHVLFQRELTARTPGGWSGLTSTRFRGCTGLASNFASSSSTLARATKGER
eukprot:1427295-Pleurochrysis_carterae.AAC.2